MADETNTPNGTTNGGAANANAGEQPRPTQNPIVVNAQYVKDLSFENPNAPTTLLPGREAPSVSVNVDVKGRQIGENVYEAILTLKAEATGKENEKVFIVELEYGGVFTIQGVPKEQHQFLLLVEGPRLLFPFARAIVAEATRDGGFPPLMLNPIDFLELLRRKAAAAQAAQGAEA